MKIKLISDGTLEGTSLVHAETGEHLADVAVASWTVGGPPGYNEASVILSAIPAEVTGSVSTIIQVDDSSHEIGPIPSPKGADIINILDHIKRKRDE